MTAGRDFYKILGVPRDADEDALKKSYKKQAVKYHPDKHANKSEKERAAAEERFKEVAEAFEVLSDKDKRAVYDRYGEDGLKAGGGGCGGGGGGCGMPAGFGGMMGGMPGNMHFSFSTNGKGGGMDAARAEAMFAQFFGGGAGGGMGGMHSLFGDDDPFAGLMGGRGMRMGGGGMGGGGHKRRRRAAAVAADILPPGTVCRLAGLSAANLNGAAATVEELDANKMRYAVTLGDGQTISVKPSNLRQVISDARVVGTSKEELNGKVAASATYDSTSGRYVCEGLKADGTSISLKPENLILPPDCRVTIEGVTSRPGLNGKVGRVAGVERDRYVVQLPDNEQVKLRFGAVAAC